MDERSCFIDGSWQTGTGETLVSTSPVDEGVLWAASQATAADVDRAITSAREAQPAWEATSLTDRTNVIRRFAELVEQEKDRLAELISLETGKPEWEAATEVASVVGKVQLSIDAQAERTGPATIGETARLSYRALGVIGILGPFNFPAHLPNGQIIPALLAGNSVVYKPSELTPAVAAAHVNLLAAAGVPPGVINMVAGGRTAGERLVAGPVDGIAFTGSVTTGRAIHRALADRPEVLLALEMGGNNPLVVADTSDISSAVNLIIRSAFITAGQRCTCARRLYIPATPEGDALLAELVETTKRLIVGAPGEKPEPFLGPVISPAAAERIRAHVADLEAAGATVRTGPGEPVPGTGFVQPTIIDCEGVDIPDDEIFGPVLTVQRYGTLDDGFAMAADTSYGLAAGLIGGERQDFDRFTEVLRVGLVNWNAPTTGASGRLPFGGVGLSGNHRPAGWTAADFCAYPVASIVNQRPTDAVADIQGLAD